MQSFFIGGVVLVQVPCRANWPEGRRRRESNSLSGVFFPAAGGSERDANFIWRGEGEDQVRAARRHGFIFFIMFCHQLAGSVCLGFCRKRRRWVRLAIFCARLPFLRSPNLIVLSASASSRWLILPRDGNRKLHPPQICRNRRSTPSISVANQGSQLYCYIAASEIDRAVSNWEKGQL